MQRTTILVRGKISISPFFSLYTARPTGCPLISLSSGLSGQFPPSSSDAMPVTLPKLWTLRLLKARYMASSSAVGRCLSAGGSRGTPFSTTQPRAQTAKAQLAGSSLSAALTALFKYVWRKREREREREREMLCCQLLIVFPRLH